jgi:hypothetical protein
MYCGYTLARPRFEVTKAAFHHVKVLTQPAFATSSYKYRGMTRLLCRIRPASIFCDGRAQKDSIFLSKNHAFKGQQDDSSIFEAGCLEEFKRALPMTLHRSTTSYYTLYQHSINLNIYINGQPATTVDLSSG